MCVCTTHVLHLIFTSDLGDVPSVAAEPGASFFSTIFSTQRFFTIICGYTDNSNNNNYYYWCVYIVKHSRARVIKITVNGCLIWAAPRIMMTLLPVHTHTPPRTVAHQCTSTGSGSLRRLRRPSHTSTLRTRTGSTRVIRSNKFSNEKK